MDGDRYERRFVGILDDTEHWWAQRAAASGSGTTADLPDVTLAHDGIAFAGEMKASSEPYIYIGEEEMAALQRYAAAYGMRAVAIGRFNRDPSYYVWNPRDMGRTDAGTYRGDPEGDRWAARIKEPDTAADGIDAADLSSFHLRHGLAGELGKGITTAPANGVVPDAD